MKKITAIPNISAVINSSTYFNKIVEKEIRISLVKQNVLVGISMS